MLGIVQNERAQEVVEVTFAEGAGSWYESGMRVRVRSVANDRTLPNELGRKCDLVFLHRGGTPLLFGSGWNLAPSSYQKPQLVRDWHFDEIC